MRRFEYLLLDSEDRPLGALDGVTGGSAEIAAAAELGGSGQVDITGPTGIDWLRDRLRVTYVDDEIRWDVGTFKFASPEDMHSGAFKAGVSKVRHRVGLLTKMNVVNEDSVTARFSVAEGANTIATALAMLQSTGESRISVTPSDSTLTAPLSWEAGTSKLKIINELLQAAGYWSLWCDGSGQFRIQPYADPAARPVAREFVHGEASIHLPDWSRFQDLANVPNQITVVSASGPDEEPLVSFAVNENLDSPFSVPNRGQVISAETVTNVEVDSQAALDAFAAQRLAGLMAPVSTIRVQHKPVRLNRNDLVAFTPEDGRRRLATVQRMRVQFVFNTNVQAEWREVL